MYVTGRKTYRGARAGIEKANIVIVAVIAVCAVLSVFKVYKEMFFFPVIFYLGGILNILSGIKLILENRKALGIIECIVGVAIFAFAVYTTFVLWI